MVGGPTDFTLVLVGVSRADTYAVGVTGAFSADGCTEFSAGIITVEITAVPRVISSSPVDSAIDVLETDPIVIEFNYPVVPSDGERDHH